MIHHLDICPFYLLKLKLMSVYFFPRMNTKIFSGIGCFKQLLIFFISIVLIENNVIAVGYSFFNLSQYGVTPGKEIRCKYSVQATT